MRASATHVAVITSVHQPFDGRIFSREARSLADAGYRVTLFAPADFERGEHGGVLVVGVPGARSRWHRPVLWWTLLRRVLFSDAQVVHLHDPELLLLVPWLRLVRGRRLGIIYDAHEYFVDSLADKHWIPRLLRPAVMSAAGWLERRLSAACDGIICAVDGQRETFRHVNKPVAVVRNFPRIESFDGAKPHSDMGGDYFNLVYAGLILEKRGIDTLLEAMKTVAEQGHRDIRLVLIGPETSSTYMGHILRFVADHSLGDQISWQGFVPHDQVKHYLAGAQVGMAPGRATHQYSRPSIASKLFEYMVSGLPVVCADLPSWGCYVTESTSGLVVAADDPREMADAILWLKHHPDEARQMGARGRQMVLDRYAWSGEQERLLELYAEVRSSGAVNPPGE